MRIKSVLYVLIFTLSTVALLLSLSIIPFAILPIIITAASILTVSFAYLWIIGAALIDAIIDGSITGTKRFIALDADVNATNQYGNTPLHWAAVHDLTETALALIAKGANVNATNNHGETPLNRAVVYGHTEIALALIAKGANVNAADQHGQQTPLHRAAEHGHTETALALIAAGADVHATNNYGETPLNRAAVYCRSETARAIEHPLHFAARLCDIKTVKALIDKGYDMQAKLYDKTPLDHAIAADNLNVAKYLIALTKTNFEGLIMPNFDNSTTKYIKDMHKLATTEHDTSAASALTVGRHATQDQLSKRIQNSKIDFAKALFGMPTTSRAKAMVKFMMFNLTFKIKGSYRDAILIARDLVETGTTNKGKTRPSLCPDVIGIILNFAGLMPDKTSIDAIAQPYYKAITSIQMTPSEIQAKYSTLPNTIITNSGPSSPAAGAKK